MTSFHIVSDVHEHPESIRVRHIEVSDVLDALRLGFEDFWDKPSHLVFLCLIYPVVGFVLITWASGANALPLIYPLVTGFALLGPIAAIGLYEISRRRELHIDTSWSHAFEVWRSPAMPSIVFVGGLLLALFLCWLVAAQLLYMAIYGPLPPASLLGFVGEVLSSRHGWGLIIVGNTIGFFFALAALVGTVVAFPLLLDRDVGAYAAIKASIEASLANPVPILAWGLIVAVTLVLGSLPLLIGLAIALPVLGHATWHLYRKVIEGGPGA